MYVINLKRDERKRKDMVEKMRILDLPFEFVDAVDGQQISRDDNLFTKYIFSGEILINNSEIGCMLSHIKTWNLILEGENDYGVIFEDDMITYLSGKDIEEKIRDAFQAVPDLDVLYLGKCLDNCLKLEPAGSKSLYHSKYMYCLHAYVITKNAISKILATAPFSVAVDSFLRDLSERNKIKTLVYHPSLIFQDIVSYSSSSRSQSSSLASITECHDYSKKESRENFTIQDGDFPNKAVTTVKVFKTVFPIFLIIALILGIKYFPKIKLQLIFLSIILFTIFHLCFSFKENMEQPKIKLNIGMNKNIDRFSSFHVVSPDQTHYFIYNPSIQWADKNKKDLVVISRISGHLMIPRLRNCMNSHSKSTIIDHSTIEGFNSYLEHFEGYKEGSSAIVKYNLSLDNQMPQNPSIVNPFFTKQNLCNELYQGFEDSRIFEFHGKHWIICYFRGKNFPFPSLVDTEDFGHYIIIFPLDKSQNPVILDYKNRKVMEKNWMPFEYNGELYVVYSIKPHKILKVNTKNGECTDFSATDFPGMEIEQDIGNGAPPQLFNVRGKDYFLGMGHVRGEIDGEMIRKNFLYLFEAKPPFKIVAMSKIFDILDNFIFIEFGSGLLVNEKDEEVYISFGKDDCHGIIVTLPKNKVLDILY